MSVEAGDWVHYSGDSQLLHWSLGPELFTKRIAEAKGPAEGDENQPERITIGFKAKHANPNGVLALVGGRIVTMGSAGVIDNGVILVAGNRIKAVGPRSDVKIPKGASRRSDQRTNGAARFCRHSRPRGAGDFRNYSAAKLGRFCSIVVWGHNHSRPVKQHSGDLCGQ